VIGGAAAHVIRGFLMGLADIVPGVSGGTIALVLGIYERLISNIRRGSGALASLVRLKPAEFLLKLKEVDWVFLVALLGGILIAVVSMAGVLTTQLEERPEVMSALFFGFIVSSIYVSFQLVKSRDLIRLLVLVGSSAASFWLLGLRTGVVENPTLLMVFGAGALAICAMILPGVSGSFILLMLGMYEFVLDAVDERDLVVIAVFGLGAVVGLGSFSTLLNWLLRSYHDTVLAVLIGVMVGSLRVLWPWPADDLGLDQVDLGSPESATFWPALIAAVVGALLVLGLSRMSRESARLS
jgi:putative membrane protein